MAEHTPGPWEVFINDSGDKWSGWPISIMPKNSADKSIVRPGGFYPYEWDEQTSQSEACANACRIVAAVNFCTGIETDRLEGVTLEEVVEVLDEITNFTDTTSPYVDADLFVNKAKHILSYFTPRSTVEPDTPDTAGDG